MNGIVAVLLLSASIALQADDLRAELQAHFDQACQSGKFKSAASVTVDGKILFAAACGGSYIMEG
jgi:hypothetical protein